MASRKIQQNKGDGLYTHPYQDKEKEEAGGIINEGLDNQETVRSLAELLPNESSMAQEEMPPSPQPAPKKVTLDITPAAKSNGVGAPATPAVIIIDNEAVEEEEEDIEEEGTV